MSNSPTTNLTLRQTMLSFAYLAYTGEGITTSNPEPAMSRNITAALGKITSPVNLSGWSIVWGPVAYTVPGSLYQDNMMYVVRNGTTSEYVIAIRGTNFTSQVDWFLEDFEVINTMPWPMPGARSNCPASAAISESTSIDMNVLVGPDAMTDPQGGTLLAFLSSKTARGAISVCVTGHSLGGVVSNTLGLYLLENPQLWDSTGRSTVCCISFAAPTAGNASFAGNANAVYAAAVSKGSFPGWDSTLNTNLDNVACNMDGAPLLCTGTNIYNGSGAGSLFSIYSSPINSTDNIDFGNLPALANEEWKYFQSLVLQNLAALTTAQNYTQLASQVFQGSFQGSTLQITGATTSLMDFLDAFAVQAAWQHSCSYPLFLGAPVLFDPTIVVRGTPPAPVPQITSISPPSASWLHPLGVTVTITGTGFSTNKFGNFIVFSGQPNLIPYEIVSVSATQIVATFKVGDLNEGPQSVSVVTTNPYYTSNSVTFTITPLDSADGSRA